MTKEREIEPTFTLKGSDPVAPVALDRWIAVSREMGTADESFLDYARWVAHRMREYRIRLSFTKSGNQE